MTKQVYVYVATESEEIPPNSPVVNELNKTEDSSGLFVAVEVREPDLRSQVSQD